jgi:hypothetical protein
MRVPARFTSSRVGLSLIEKLPALASAQPRRESSEAVSATLSSHGAATLLSADSDFTEQDIATGRAEVKQTGTDRSQPWLTLGQPSVELWPIQFP